ncbi:MAG: aminotransferase class V-fold PLP-dependent enzyme [Anaerolineales bacterium]|nr:aminotransferase class V-fold PLP-dependent enzyme [Anaerolineales bacterium]
MKTQQTNNSLQDRVAPIEMNPDDFRAAGHDLIDVIADFLTSLPERPVSPGETPLEVRQVLGKSSLPDQGTSPSQLLDETANLLFEHSLFNGHPRFLGYITASAAPIGALADLLATAVNPNVGGWSISPMASEIEAQTVRWIAELIGYPSDCGGLLVSGGNVANFVGFLAARRRKLGEDVRSKGMRDMDGGQPVVYCSAETHTWIQKAADLFGIGTDAIRWVPTNEKLQMDLDDLRKQIESDKANGYTPFLVVGTGGSTGVGAVDALPSIAEICREHDLWFHVDGAYGGFAAAAPNAPSDLRGLSQADSVAIDPHKWLYSALEVGCALVRDPATMIDTFSYRPSYYKFEESAEEAPINFYEYGPQNSRGFRALKVWLGMRQAGRNGHLRMIEEDIQLAEHLYRIVDEHPELDAFTQNLSITTFRYVPHDLNRDRIEAEEYLNELNEELLARIQNGGEAYISNAVVGGKYLLRSCIVNFRTSLEDVQALPEIVTRLGSEVDAALRPDHLKVAD